MLGGVRRKVIDEAEFALHVTRIAQPSLRGVWRAPENILRVQWSGERDREGSASGGLSGSWWCAKTERVSYLSYGPACTSQRQGCLAHVSTVASPAWHARDVSGRIKIGERNSEKVATSVAARWACLVASRAISHLAIANPRPRADCRLYSFTKGTRPHCSKSTV